MADDDKAKLVLFKKEGTSEALLTKPTKATKGKQRWL